MKKALLATAGLLGLSVALTLIVLAWQGTGRLAAAEALGGAALAAVMALAATAVSGRGWWPRAGGAAE